MSRSNIRINDYLEPVSDIRQIHKIKFDPDSPLFARAVANLQVDSSEIAKKRLKDFKEEVALEQPESETNAELILEMAQIRYNYHLNAFKDAINDIMEERDKLKLEQRMQGMRDKVSTSQQKSYTAVNSRGNTSPSSLKHKSLSTAALRPESLTLTSKDVQHINKMQDRNDRFTNKLLVEQQLKEKHKSTIEELQRRHL